jgi:cyclase
MVSESVGIPVVAHGGAGKPEHISEVVIEGKASAVAAASMIHYDFIANKQSNMENRSEGNLSFLKSGRTSFGKIQPQSLSRIKQHLKSSLIPCRI